MTKQRKRSRGNGEGSIVKLSGKRKRPYAARVTTGWTNGGKQLFKYVGYYSTKTEAKNELNNFLINPYDLNANNLTAMDIYDKWVTNAKFSEDVLKNYKRVIENSGLSKKVFKDITLFELENATKDLTPAMQKRFKAAWKHLYEYGMRHDLVNKNLADIMQLEKYVAGKRDAISLNDVKVVLKGDDNIAKILLYTGMRINELLEIKSSNVFIEERYMIGGKKTLAGINRVIPLHRDILPIIKDFLSKNTNYLITDEKGKKVNYNNYLNTWKSNEVLKTTSPHFARHTFVSRAVACGIQKTFIQKIVGHSNSDVTDHYTHLSKEQLIEAIDKFMY